MNIKSVCFDTEFYCYGDIIELISIGCVAETGEEFYAENSHFSLDYYDNSETAEFLNKHVVPQLRPYKERLTPQEIRHNLLVWTNNLSAPTKWWAWYGAYDFVLLCKLFGGFHKLPLNISNRFRELADLPITNIPKPEGAHHALTDARWNFKVWSKNHERIYATAPTIA